MQYQIPKQNLSQMHIMVSLKTLIHDKLSIVMSLSSRRIAKDNQDIKDQKDISTTRSILLHVLYYTTAIVDYHEIASHNKKSHMFYTRAATSRHFVNTKSNLICVFTK